MKEYDVTQYLSLIIEEGHVRQWVKINPGDVIGSDNGFIFYHADGARAEWTMCHNLPVAITTWLESGRISLREQETLQPQTQMPRIREYIVKTPIVVTRMVDGSRQAVGIPEGGSIGFDGTRLYEVTSKDCWGYLATNKNAMIEWLSNHHVEKKQPTKLSDRFKSLIMAAKEIKEKEQGPKQEVAVQVAASTEANTVPVQEKPIEAQGVPQGTC